MYVVSSCQLSWFTLSLSWTTDWTDYNKSIWPVSKFGTGVWAETWTSDQRLLTCTLSVNMHLPDRWCHTWLWSSLQSLQLCHTVVWKCHSGCNLQVSFMTPWHLKPSRVSWKKALLPGFSQCIVTRICSFCQHVLVKGKREALLKSSN